MAGMPTVTVKLDSVTNDGTFPYDVSTYVRLTDGVNIGRGRGDEFTDVQPSTLSLTLENTDARFTLGSTSGGYGAINIDRGIQVSYTINAIATTRFTGYVQNWPVEWPDGSDQFAVAKITAVDRLARLARRVLRSIIEQEILLDSPTVYYTLGEAAGATSAGDTSGSALVPMTAAGTGAAVVFGNATGPSTDGLTAASFASGSYLSANQVASLVGYSTWTAEAFFTTSTSASAHLIYLWSTPANKSTYAYRLGISAAGKLEAYLMLGGSNAYTLTSPSSVAASGALHHGAIRHVISGGNLTATLFLDGANVASTTIADPGGFSGGHIDVGSGFTGSVAHAAVFAGGPGLADARIWAHAFAGFDGFAGESSGVRIKRYADYANIATADRSIPIGTLASTPHLDITGTNVLAAMAKVTQAEGGLLFIRGDGKIVMQSREQRAIQVTPNLTLTTNDISPDSRLAADMQLVRNYVTASAGSNGAIQIAKNQASIDGHEQYPDDLSGLLVTTDEEALQAANWRATVYAEPATRMPSLSADLLTLTAAQAASLQSLEISGRFQITGLPSQALNGTTTADLIVEGWTETLTDSAWDMQFNTSNFSQAQAWVLGDSTYGVLGTTTRLSY